MSDQSALSRPPAASYAQNGEDVILWRALGDVSAGFYVDVGAHDPVYDSVTQLFYERGWSGVNLEPLPDSHRRFTEARPRDVNLAVAAGSRMGTVTLQEVAGREGWATASAETAAAHRMAGLTLRPRGVPLVTLDSVLELHAPATIHFLKIDVEGAERDVLLGLDLRRFRPWVLVIEATRPGEAAPNEGGWEPLLLARGYRFAYFDGLNRYYLADEQGHRLGRLACQPNPFDGFVPRELARAWAEASSLRETLAAQERAHAAQREAHAVEARAAHGRIAALEAAQGELQARHAQHVRWADDAFAQLMAIRGSALWRGTWPLRWLRRGAPLSDLRRAAGVAAVALQRRAPSLVAAPLRAALTRLGGTPEAPLAGTPVAPETPPPAVAADAPVARPAPHSSPQSPPPADASASTDVPLAAPAASAEVPPAAAPPQPHPLEEAPIVRRARDDLVEALAALRREAPAATDEGAPVGSAAGPSRRARLAYVSPLPPVRSGIADYSAEVLAALRAHYEIDAVVEQELTDGGAVPEGVRLCSVRHFEAHAAEYDRVVYHFGNSPAHAFLFPLLRRQPGVVVLHDFYLANLVEYCEAKGLEPGAFTTALYEGHGHEALRDLARLGAAQTVHKYPCNAGVLEAATGVIVHSEEALRMARACYGAAQPPEGRPGEAARAHFARVPLLRAPASRGDRAAARRRLGLDDDVFLVGAFGHIGYIKHARALADAWLGSELPTRGDCRLVFVGALGGDEYCRALEARLAAPDARSVAITGYADRALYEDYLAAVDVAVQLRTSSRGESSASTLDCLVRAIPTVVNAHGSLAELPDDAVHKLPDDFTPEALAAALDALRRDRGGASALGLRGRTYAEACHGPAHAAGALRDALESLHRDGPAARYRGRVAQVARQLAGGPVSDATLLEHALALAPERRRLRAPHLYVDVSGIVHGDLHTGIQRVVRAILAGLLREAPSGRRVEPVYSPGLGLPYRHARAFMARSFGEPVCAGPDEVIDVVPGDVFLGLDLHVAAVPQNEAVLATYRALGAQLYFTVYDLLPLLLPQYFPEPTPYWFGRWFETITRVGDGLLAISNTVADEVRTRLEAQGLQREGRPLRIGAFHLGADLRASLPLLGLPADAERLLAALRAHATFLMVGTVEPRKGHAQALAAFERLWAEGQPVNLCIVGKSGWMVDALTARLRSHPERGRRLHWLEDASDELLERLYDASAALLAASEGEGFGLPLIEAAQRKTPLLVRDLPVFREIAGEHAYYFHGAGPDDLADALRRWLALRAGGAVPASTELPWLTWAQSARALCAVLLEGRWRHVLGSSNSALGGAALAEHVGQSQGP